LDRLRKVAVRHDQRLRSALSDAEAELLADLSERASKTESTPRGRASAEPLPGARLAR